VGTFGTGPFSSDGALDFLDELGERVPDQRAGALGRWFAHMQANPDRLWKDYFPDEVIAAVALVVAALPGGKYLRDTAFAAFEEAAAAALPGPAPELVVPARNALLTVAGSGGAWLRGWKDEDAQAEAQATVDGLLAVLDAAMA